MRKVNIILTLFVILAIIQLSIPLYMAWHWEDIRRNGQSYQWRTAPVDPYDAFRGRYVDLRFKESKGPVASGEKLSSGQNVYAAIAVDANGFAYISSVSAGKPKDNVYVEARLNYVTGNTADVTLPFKRYYLEENKAPAADIAYRKSAGKDGKVTVRIKDGLGVVEQLYIGEQTIDEYLNDQRGKQ